MTFGEGITAGPYGTSGCLADHQIRSMAEKGMIVPYAVGKKRKGCISYGITHYGYDFRISDEFILFSEWAASKYLDPKNFDPELLGEKVLDSHAFNVATIYRSEEGSTQKAGHDCDSRYDGKSWFNMPPNSHALGRTVETFHIPDNVFALAAGKSTYARLGLQMNTTPFEPGWRGQATISIVNPTSSTIRIYIGEGFGQIQFWHNTCTPTLNYEKKGGVYQDSKGIVGSKVHQGEEE